MYKTKRRKMKILAIVMMGLLVLVLAVYFSPPAYTSRLNKAIRDNDEKKVAKILKQWGDVNRRNSMRLLRVSWNTPLEEACIEGNIDIIKMLVDEGAKVNLDDGGWSPLVLSLSNESEQQYEIVRFLISRGATLRDESNPPIWALLAQEYAKVERRGMWVRFKKDYINEEEMYNLFMLLVENGASVNEGREMGLPMQEVIWWGAALQGNRKIVDYLLNKEGLDIDLKISDEKTALMVAVEYNNGELVEHLIFKDADTTIVNDEGKTALDIAKEQGNKEIISLLQ